MDTVTADVRAARTRSEASDPANCGGGWRNSNRLTTSAAGIPGGPNNDDNGGTAAGARARSRRYRSVTRMAGGGSMVLASGLVEYRARLAIGNLSCNARMECRSVRAFATIEASFPIGPIQFTLNASVLNGFSMTIAGAWEHTTGRIDLGNCWGRGYAGVTASLAIRSNPSRGQARIELTGTAAVKGRIWGDWCWAGTPDNESDRWRWSLSAGVRVTLDPWSLTVTVDFGIPGSITIGPIAGVRVRIE